MKCSKKIISAFVLLSAAVLVSAVANAAEYSVKRTVQNEITVSGAANKSELLAVQILKTGTTPTAIETDNSLGGPASIFSKTLTADDDGAFTFNVKIPQTGEYTAYIRAVSDKEPKTQKFAFALDAEKDTVVSQIISKLNKGESVDAVSYIKDFLFDDTEFTDYLEKFTGTDAQKEFFLKKLQNRSISDYETLKTKAKEALILTAARESDGPANLQAVMSSYNDILNISSLTDKMAVYTALKGEYADIAALKTAYSNAVKSASGASSGGGGGGGGGSNASGTYSSTSVGSVQYVTNPENDAVPINIRFEDLAKVEWAYEYISRLFDKGIVNGVSEHLYRPDNPVKREEFVKLIVCAMKLQDEEAQNAEFSDVGADAWFKDYVNVAKKFGISRGMSADKFGTGAEISRQDMAQMIYNAMKIKGYMPVGAQNTFSDSAACADYAKEAIAELCTKGVVGGVGDNMFDPQGIATRAQAAVIISRALEYLE